MIDVKDLMYIRSKTLKTGIRLPKWTKDRSKHILYKVWGDHKSHWQLQGSRSGL